MNTTTQTTIEQVQELVIDLLGAIGVDGNLLKACQMIITGESQDPSPIQRAAKQQYQMTQETAQQVFRLHALYQDEEFHETVTLGCFMLYWLTDLMWVLPHMERLRLEAAQSLARLGLNGEQLVACQLYIMDESDDISWWNSLPQVNLDRLPQEPHWAEFIALYDYLGEADTQDGAERYFQVLERIGGLPVAYFERSMARTRSTALWLLGEAGLEPADLERVMRYVLGEIDDALLREPLPHVDVTRIPPDAWQGAVRAFEIWLNSLGAERERMLRFFHVLHHLGGTEAFYAFWPLIKKGRVLLLEKLFAFDQKHYGPVLVEHLEDTSKTVREKVIDLLAGYRGADDAVLEMLKNPERDAREAALLVISAWQDDSFQPALAEAYAVEKNDSVKKSLQMLVKGGLPIMDPSLVRDEVVETLDQLVNYSWKHLRNIEKNHLSWLDLSKLPQLRYQDSEEIVDEAVYRYFLMSYADLKEWKINPAAGKIVPFVNVEDLHDLTYELLLAWIEAGAELKKRWVLHLAGMHGDQRVIDCLMEQVLEWPKHNRSVIACDGVRALALTGDLEALRFIDSIAMKFKYPKVRGAAGGAYAFAADLLGLDADEIADRAITDFGYDERGLKVLDFGNRQFLSRITSTLTIALLDDEGKQMKSLPKMTEQDDAERFLEAKEELSLLRKKLKMLAGVQTLRLDNAQVAGRKWQQDGWKRLFLQHPVMRRVGYHMVWGAYVDGTLQQSFRYLKDGTLKTLENRRYHLPPDALIGLVQTKQGQA